MLIRTNGPAALDTLPTADFDARLLASFARLPPDEYLKSERCFRFRAYSSGLADRDGDIHWDESVREFFQDPVTNPYAGGISRHFPSLPASTRRFAHTLLATAVARHLVSPSSYHVGVHQIRVTAQGDSPGLPTPEGFHHDGFDCVLIACVALNNVSGGDTLVRTGAEVILDHAMSPGEILVLDDRAAMHYVSPIVPRQPGSASRDVIVMTLSTS